MSHKFKRGGVGPPDDAARTASPSHPGTCVKGITAATHTRHPQATTARHLGRYTAGWRDGFTAGALDALRLAARQLSPEAWPALDALANDYELVSDD